MIEETALRSAPEPSNSNRPLGTKLVSTGTGEAVVAPPTSPRLAQETAATVAAPSAADTPSPHIPPDPGLAPVCRSTNPALAHQTMRSFTIASLLLAAVTLVPTFAAAQQPQDPAKQDATKGPRIMWQRTLRDALWLAKKHNLPLLVVGNRDNETACESLVRGRYKSASFTGLANRYVAVIGSLDRHNPVDFDAAGRRILCPRFGCVTCGEHLRMEPKLFAAYFKNRRVAPRHIGIGTDGKELFDRFLDPSLRAVDESLKANAKQDGPIPNILSAETSLKARLKSAANRDRDAVDKAFAAADAMQRAGILGDATTSGIPHPNLVRMGLADRNPEVQKAAVALLRSTASSDDLSLVLQALGRARTDAEFTGRLPILAAIAKDDEPAKLALQARTALITKSKLVDPELWQTYFTSAKAPATPESIPNEALAALDTKIDAATKRARATKDGKAWLEAAQATFDYALNRRGNGKDPTFLLLDTERALNEATKAGVPAPVTAPLRARVLWMTNKRAEAGKAAVLAVTGTPATLVAYAHTHTAPRVLEILAQTQLAIVYQPIEKDGKYPSEAIANVHAAYDALTRHPAATAREVKAHLDFLLYLGARYHASVAIAGGLERFPSDPSIHQYHRDHALWKNGNTGMETAYDHIPREKRVPSIDWFAGYGCLIAAEGHVRAKILVAAKRAYGKAIRNLQRSGDAAASFRDSAQHYVALAYGGLGKLALDAQDFATAKQHVLAGMTARPASFGSPDGLGNNLRRTVRRLRRKLDDAGKAEIDAQLEALKLTLEEKN